MSERGSDFLTFFIDYHRFAIPVKDVEKVERAVTITPVPESGESMYGVFNYHGTLLPVINLRSKFSIEPKEINYKQRLLIVNTPLRQLAIVVDDVGEVSTVCKEDLSEAVAIENHSKRDVIGRALAFNDKNGIVILYKLESLLSGELDNELSQLHELLRRKESINE